MAFVVEEFIIKTGVQVDVAAIRRAKTETDKYKVAGKLLEEEQRRSAKTTLALRDRMLDLRTQLAIGKLTQDQYRKAVRQVRISMSEEQNEARRAAAAMRELKQATREMTAETRAFEKAERSALDAIEKRARVAERAAARERTRSNRGFTVARGVVAGVATNAITGAARAVAGGAVDAVRESFGQAVEFESKMADVAKVVDGLKDSAGNALPAYRALGDELKTLSTRIAVAPNGLAEMAAAAGAAGIKGQELTSFVEDAAKTMVAFDISSEEAGNALAKLRANLGINQDEVRGLAGTMNQLSNSMASTAAEVLDATLRVGAVGKAAGLSGQEVAGLSSAMIAAGATSEIAATATKNFVLSMASGTAATRRQREAFSALGLNSADVAKQFTGSLEQRMAISRKVIMEMGKLSADKRAAVSMQLFGRESLGPIASLTTNLKNYDEAMRIANDTTAAASSVQREFEVRSNTTENAIQLLKNKFSVLAIEVGEGMMPAVRDVIRDMGEFLGVSKDAGETLGETLGAGIRRAWEALKEFIGPADQFPGKVEAMIDKASAFASAVMTIVEAVVRLVSTLSSTDNAFGIMANGIMSLAGPIEVITSSLSGLLEVLRGVMAGKSEIMSGIDEQIAAGYVTGGANDQGSDEANLYAFAVVKRKGAHDRKLRDSDDAAYEARQLGMGTAPSAGRHRLQAEEGARGGAVPMYVPGKGGKRTIANVASLTAEQAAANKRERWNELAGKKRRGVSLRQSEKKEFRDLTKELDEVDVTKNKAPKKHKAETAYEGELEGEVQRLSKEAGVRAGAAAAAKGQSRKQQFAAAKAAEERTTKALHERVDAGMSLPGNFMHDQLRRAQFQDVANRGTPPPIAVTIIDVKPMNVEIGFSGPVTADPRELREFFRRFWREELPAQLNMGIREARIGGGLY